MQRHVILVSFLVLTAAAGWWALHRAPPSASPPVEVAAHEGHPPSVVEAVPDDPAAHGQPETAAEAPASLSPPLLRQRDRLQAAATRLRARRNEAEAGDRDEITIAALDDHLARLEQRLADLEVAHD